MPVDLVSISASWLAGRLFNCSWDKVKKIVSPLEVLQAFERACKKIIERYPHVFSSVYTVQALTLTDHEAEGKELSSQLHSFLYEAKCPTVVQLLEILKMSWNQRKADLNADEAEVFFTLSEEHALPILSDLANIFFSELAQIDSISKPAVLKLAHQTYALVTESIFDNLEILLSNPNRHPNRYDFESDAFFRNDEIHKTILDKIGTQRKCLLIGKPGTGKTAIARSLGYELASQSGYKVYYLVANKKPYPEKWLNYILSNDLPDYLFIIDDCHKATEDVNSFIDSSFTIKYAKLILISRSIESDIAGVFGENFIESLQHVTVTIKIDATTVYGVALKLAKSKLPSLNSGVDMEMLLKRCNGDLHLLRSFIDAWMKAAPHTPFGSVSDAAVLDDVYRRYLHGKRHWRGLLSIASLSMFEIPVETSWIAKYDDIEIYLKEGTVDTYTLEDAHGKTAMFQYFHSTPAGYLLRAAYHKGMLNGLNLWGFVYSKLQEYLSTKPVNFFDCFHDLHVNQHCDVKGLLLLSGQIQSALVSNIDRLDLNALPDDLIKVVRVLVSLSVTLGNDSDQVLDSLARLKTKFALKEWIRFLERAPISALEAIINLGFIDRQFVDQVLQELDYSKIALRFRNCSFGMLNILISLASRAGIGLHYFKRIIDSIDSKYLAVDYGRRFTLSNISTFVRNMSELGVEKIKIQAFIDNIDFERVDFDTSLNVVRDFIRYSVRADLSRMQLKSIIERVNYSKFGQRSQNSSLTAVCDIIRRLSATGISKEKVETFCKALDWRRLGESALQRLNDDLPFFDLDAINTERAISKDMAKDFVEGLGWDSIGGRLTGLSPDTLAAIRILLMNKCEFTPDVLNNHSIDLRTQTIWLRSFVDCPLSPKLKSSDRRITHWNKYVKYASRGLASTNVSANKIKRYIRDLKGWNILIHNLTLAAPSFLVETVLPIIESFRKEEYYELFDKSDLKNIGIFLGHFSPHIGVFPWRFFPDFDFRKYLGRAEVLKSDLNSLSRLLTNLHAIQKPKCANYFASELGRNNAFLICLIGSELLSPIVDFLWSFWLSSTTNEFKFLDEDQVSDILSNKVDAEPTNKQRIVELAGLYSLAVGGVPDYLCRMIDVKTTKKMIYSLSNNMRFELVRVLSGIMATYPDSLTDEEKAMARDCLGRIVYFDNIPKYKAILSLLSGKLGD